MLKARAAVTAIIATETKSSMNEPRVGRKPFAKTHIDDVCLRASKTLFALSILRKLNCRADLLWKIYNSLCRSILSYAYPAWCNVTNSQAARLLQVESRAGKIIGTKPALKLNSFCEGLCFNLAAKVNKDPNHPLREIFDEAPYRQRRSQTSNVLRAPYARTEKFRKSFIFYI